MRLRLPTLGAAAALVAITLLIAGCAGWGRSPIEQTFDEARRLDGSTASVDFDKLYPGDWDRVLLVCIGTTPAELDEALGFEWADGPDVESTGFLSAIVLASADSATIATQTGADSDWSFVPCTPSVHGGDVGAGNLLTIPRSASVVRFTLEPDRSHSYWYISADEFDRLASDG